MNEHEGTIDDIYMTWLYQHFAVVSNKNPARSYWKLTEQLYTIPFKWTVPNDDNRAADGLELRDEFIVECQVENVDIHWRQRECSFLEMLIALARRTSYNAMGTSADWFGKFLKNLGICFSDREYTVESAYLVNLATETVNNRKYDGNGLGGLFPLEYPCQDQREVELWYQASAYLLEGGYLDHAP